MTQVKLTIFVSQINGKMESLVRDLHSTLADNFNENYQLDVVNVLEMPEKAIEHGVFVTPTLVRTFPEPVLKILGDLSDTQSTLTKIDLDLDNGSNTLII